MTVSMRIPRIEYRLAGSVFYPHWIMIGRGHVWMPSDASYKTFARSIYSTCGKFLLFSENVFRPCHVTQRRDTHVAAKVCLRWNADCCSKTDRGNNKRTGDVNTKGRIRWRSRAVLPTRYCASGPWMTDRRHYTCCQHVSQMRTIFVQRLNRYFFMQIAWKFL